MNLSSLTSAVVRDDLNTAILKNVILVVLCISINYINATLVLTFIRQETFKMNPRYILYIHLVINDIILLTLFTLIHLLSYIVYTLNVSLCIVLLLITVSANLNNPMTLAIMALECYVAVCFPLRHSQICTVKRTYVVISFIWVISSLSLLPEIFIILATEPLEFFNAQMFCLKANIFRLSYLAEKDAIFNSVLMAIVWLTLFYTYFKIIFTAKTAAVHAKKARNTVLLHSFQLMLSMLIYFYYVILAGLTYLFPNSVLAIRFAVSLFITVMPRLVSPLVYGIRDKAFRKYLKQHMFCRKAVS